MQSAREARPGATAYYRQLSRHRHLEKDAFVELGSSRISYRELFEAADTLGDRLTGLMGQGNHTVGVYQAKSIASVVSIFGILSAGKAFVPIDPKWPSERLAHIVRNAGVRLLICDPDVGPDALRAMEGLDVTVLVCRPAKGRFEHVPQRVDALARRPAEPICDEPLSHVLFTSGTTGAPKGVMVRQDSQVAFTACMAEAFGHDLHTRWLSVSPLYFDVCTLDLFVEAHCGATVVLMRPNPLPHEVAEALESQRITHVLLISSLVKMLASSHSGIENRRLPELRALWYGGEACPVEALRRLKSLFPGLGFAQCYGPSEVCNNATLHRFDDIPADATGYMPLGRPLETVEAYVVGEDGRPIERGVGELYLGGVQVMAGYVNNAEATAKALSRNWLNPNSPRPLYRTGDYVRLDDQGLLHFHGRKDDLVKLRGNRISLHEVQSTVIGIPGVIDALLYIGKDDIAGMLDSFNAIVIADRDLTPMAIRAAMLARLPAYMVPDRIHVEARDGVLTKENGKIDKASLLSKYRDALV